MAIAITRNEALTRTTALTHNEPLPRHALHRGSASDIVL